MHAGIDWSRPHAFLDTELREVVRDAELGRRFADRLARVWLLDGAEAWLLLHLEVQGQRERGFARRMFVYHYRIFDRYDHEVISLAVLADQSATWRPDTYDHGRWGCTLRFQFPVAKLADWRPRQAELTASDNPFATVLLAHLAAQDTRADPPNRERAKLGLIRRLYERGYAREQILHLFRFVDWLLALSPEAELRVRQALEALEEEHAMPYITHIERLARQEGHQEGLLAARREDILEIVRARFGQAPEALATRLATADAATLNELILRAATVAAVDDL